MAIEYSMNLIKILPKILFQSYTPTDQKRNFMKSNDSESQKLTLL